MQFRALGIAVRINSRSLKETSLQVTPPGIERPVIVTDLLWKETQKHAYLVLMKNPLTISSVFFTIEVGWEIALDGDNKEGNGES